MEETLLLLPGSAPAFSADFHTETVDASHIAKMPLPFDLSANNLAQSNVLSPKRVGICTVSLIFVPSNVFFPFFADKCPSFVELDMFYIHPRVWGL